MEENKKSNKGIILLIVVLILFIIGLSGYIIYDKVFISEKKSLEKNTNKIVDKKIVDRELNESEISHLIEQIKLYNIGLGDNYPIEKVSDISKERLFDFAYSVVRRSGFRENFSVTELDDVVTKYFGTDLALEHQDIICNVDKEILYNYNQESNSYNYNNNHPGHGGVGSIADNITYYVYGKITNETDIEISTKNLYSNYCGDTCAIYAYYKNYNDSIAETNPVLTAKEEIIEQVTDDDYNRIKDILPTTTYKFKKNNNSYNLVSVSIK